MLGTLQKFGYKDDVKCSFCGEHKQTFEHLFLDCPEVIEFKDIIVIRWLKDMTFKDRDWMVGMNNPFWIFLIMEINHYIHASNYKNTYLSLVGLRGRLHNVEEVKKVIASKKSEHLVHFHKWTMVKTWIP